MASIIADKNLFNLELLKLEKETIKYLKPVTKSNILESSSSNFEPEGLFSTVIFGEIGSKERMSRFGYIDLKIPVLHPLVYTSIISLSTTYKNIVEGKTHATFSKAIGDFVIEEDGKGNTGFSFFIDNIPNIKFKDTDSTQREFKIKLIEKYKSKDNLIDKLLVLPAGLRDYSVNDKGQPSEDEINDIYRKILTTTNLITNTIITDNNLILLDPIRLRLQKLFVELYEYIVNILSGKQGFIENKWAKRAITYSTRNVLTPNIPKISNLKNKENRISINHTVVGIYQYVKSITPLAINRVKSMFLNNILDPNSPIQNLVDIQTMSYNMVEIPVKKRDEWLSTDGLIHIINKLGQEAIRENPVKIDNYYLLLIEDKETEINVISNNEELQQVQDKSKVRPITYVELLYISIYDTIAKTYCYNTRYPAIELGSIFPSKVYVKTTNPSRTINFKYGTHNFKIHEYMYLGNKYHESMSVAMCRLARLGADFDGDVLSFTTVYSEESNKELEDYINDKLSYITPDNEIVASVDNDVSSQVMKLLTIDPDVKEV